MMGKKTVLGLVLLARVTLSSFHGHDENVSFGNDLCPCLRQLPNWTDTELERMIRLEVQDPATYGLGCQQHDKGTEPCSLKDECNLSDNGGRCDREFCSRSWCYVNETNCSLVLSEMGTVRSGHRFSYGTCGDLDTYTSTARFEKLSGMRFRIGMNANSGGWTGAYRTPREQFEGPHSAWSGPAIDFARKAADENEGNYTMEIVDPRDYELVVNNSRAFFGSSSFDLCVFACSLGYVDFCISQYSITDERVSIADFFVLQSDPLYMIVQRDAEPTNWQKFKDSCKTVFSPYALETWLFAILIVVPTLGLLMCYQEIRAEGSLFYRQNMVEREDGFKEEVTNPWWIPINLALFQGLMSLFRRQYPYPFKTYGGAWMALSISFFSLLYMNVFTAKLASQLTEAAVRPSVESLQAAIDAEYRFCGERKRTAAARRLHNLDSLFVKDPEDLGGDGLAGFNCPKCKALSRAIDHIDPQRANAGDAQYCHAALATAEDLEVMQREGAHCNKAIVGEPITFVSNGFPVSARVSTELISHFTRLKNQGQFDRSKNQLQPRSLCPAWTDRAKTGSFQIHHLSGIWAVTFGFALIGILISFWEFPIQDRKIARSILKRKQHTALQESSAAVETNQSAMVIHEEHPERKISVTTRTTAMSPG